MVEVDPASGIVRVFVAGPPTIADAAADAERRMIQAFGR
jgi:hypothetical protein